MRTKIATKQQWQQWKEHPCTQEVTKAYKERLEMMKEYLAEVAGENPGADRKYTGYISAINDFLKMELVEETPEID